MEEELRRVASLVLQAPLTRRTRRELLYCGVGGLAGTLGFGSAHLRAEEFVAL